MKFNSMLLIIFCLLQVLNSSTVGLNEQSLKDAAVKTLKYARVYHQESIKLEDKDNIHDLKLNCPPLTSNNIQFSFDEYGLLHIKFINLKATVTGNYILKMIFRITVPFTAKLNNFNWEQVFVVSKKDLGNGKLDIKFKPTEESKINYNMILYNKNNMVMTNTNTKGPFPFPFIENIKNGLKDLDFNSLKNQLKKVAQLILETLQSDLK